jgi:hypothetical protein
MAAADPLAAQFVGPFDGPTGFNFGQWHAIEDDFDLEMFDNLGLFIDVPLAAEVAETRVKNVADRVGAAQQAAEGAKGAQAEAFTELSKEQTSDSQNVHDSSVNACLKAIVERLRLEVTGGLLPTIDAVRAEITAKAPKLSADTDGRPRPEMLQKVLKVMDKVGNHERNLAANVTDAEAITMVWGRAADPRNAAVCDKIKQAMFDELADAYKGNATAVAIECVNGRTARVLAALVLLDFDERNWGVKRLEQYRNEIFDLTKKTIAREATRASTGDGAPLAHRAPLTHDPLRARLGRAYLAMTPAEAAEVGDFTEEEENDFRAELTAAVLKAIDAYIAEANRDTANAIPKFMVDTIKKEAVAGIP